MPNRKIPFSKPFFTDKDITEINARIKRILRSGILTSGPTVQQFEKNFAELIGTKKAVGLNSGTAALHSVLLAFGIKNGDEVIVPSNTFVATANAVLYMGAKPVFADSDPDTFNISPNEISRKITKKTKAVIVVHLGGNPCDIKEINDIVEEHNLLLIEDCAHAHGAKYKDSNCGALGVAGCFSFYPTKIATTAEGGIVTTDNEAIAEKINIIRNHGRVSFGPSETIELGFNYRLSEIHAAIGLTQIKHIHSFIAHRRKLAEVYNLELNKIGWIKPYRVRDVCAPSYYAYIVKLTEKAPLSRDALRKKLADKGIETSVLYHPVHLQPFYAKVFGYQKGELPVAEDLGTSSLALPLYNGMKTEDALRVVGAIKEI